MYVVVLGRVKVTSTADDGYETIGRIVCTEGLFGEGALVGGRASESAMALDTASVMSWTRNEIEQQIEREPRLGIALAQYMVQQCLALQDRIESMAIQKTPERVMVALAQLAEMLGAPLPDGTTRIASLTHQTIAEYALRQERITVPRDAGAAVRQAAIRRPDAKGRCGDGHCCFQFSNTTHYSGEVNDHLSACP